MIEKEVSEQSEILTGKRVSKVTPKKEVVTFTEGMEMPKKKRVRAWKHFDFCFCCLKSSAELKCSFCPRVFHERCLEDKYDGPYKEASKMSWFVNKLKGEINKKDMYGTYV